MTQNEYIELLFDKCGFSSAPDIRNWLNLRFNRKYLDELTTQEKSKVIDELKEA